MNFIANFTAMRASAIERIAASHRSGKYTGQVTLKECPLCGSLEWVCTSENGEGVVLEPIGPGDPACATCNDAARRAPEVFGWVIQVVGFQASRREPH